MQASQRRSCYTRPRGKDKGIEPQRHRDTEKNKKEKNKGKDKDKDKDKEV
jgi:hypothetical protein